MNPNQPRVRFLPQSFKIHLTMRYSKFLMLFNKVIRLLLI